MAVYIDMHFIDDTKTFYYGEKIHESLVGNKDYIDSTIIVNVDDPSEAVLFIDSSSQTICELKPSEELLTTGMTFSIEYHTDENLVDSSLIKIGIDTTDDDNYKFKEVKDYNQMVINHITKIFNTDAYEVVERRNDPIGTNIVVFYMFKGTPSIDFKFTDLRKKFPDYYPEEKGEG